MKTTETPAIPGSRYTSALGFSIRRVDGVEYIDLDQLNDWLAESIAKLPKETRPNVQAAQDAREIIKELMIGIGGEMEKFKADSTRYLGDIRAVRSAVVMEVSQITGPLKDVRQFFLGNDYKQEVTRLQEFVELCERLQALKNSGFLDNVADTLIRLS